MCRINNWRDKMTNRLKGLTVAFEKDIREDDAEGIINAILMIRGIANVTTSLSSSEDYINREQIRREVVSKIYDVAKDI